MNYDPNLVCSGKMAIQSVKLVFGCWDYRAERVIDVAGNCMGFAVIRAALTKAYDELEYSTYKGKDYAYITLANLDEEMLCEDEERKCDEWLGDMLISAEILSIIEVAEDSLENVKVERGGLHDQNKTGDLPPSISPPC